MPSPAPIAQQVINSPSATTVAYPSLSASPAPSSTTNNTSAPTDIITTTGSFSYLGQGVNYTLSFPKNGGDVTGSFDGLCNGSANGNYTGGDGGHVEGNVSGECVVLGFIKQPVDVKYWGNIWLKQGKINLEWEGKTGIYNLNKGSFSLNFPPVN